ncbi:2Fe-2S iron-sulfur cluster-binding protein, partial [Oleiphilus sp. HI0061]
ESDKATLLEISENQGLKPVAGCRMGVCHQCICKKKTGRVFNTRTQQYSDTGEEEIQLCVSVPVGKVELEL